MLQIIEPGLQRLRSVQLQLLEHGEPRALALHSLEERPLSAARPAGPELGRLVGEASPLRMEVLNITGVEPANQKMGAGLMVH